MLAVSPCYAQGVPFEEVDINGDGSLDAAELLAKFDVAGLSLMTKDRNGDGVVSRDEIRASTDDVPEKAAVAYVANDLAAAGAGDLADASPTPDGDGDGGAAPDVAAQPSPEDDSLVPQGETADDAAPDGEADADPADDQGSSSQGSSGPDDPDGGDASQGALSDESGAHENG